MTRRALVTVLRRVGLGLVALTVAVLLTAAATGFGVHEFFEYADVNTASVADIPGLSAGRWELRDVRDVGASEVAWFGDEIELRWDRVAAEWGPADAGPLAAGTLIHASGEIPIELVSIAPDPWSPRVARVVRAGGEPLDDRPDLAICVRRSNRGWFERLLVMPHGSRAWDLSAHSLRYTRAD